jgi:hypothetical protein
LRDQGEAFEIDFPSSDEEEVVEPPSPKMSDVLRSLRETKRRARQQDMPNWHRPGQVYDTYDDVLRYVDMDYI